MFTPTAKYAKNTEKEAKTIFNKVRKTNITWSKMLSLTSEKFLLRLRKIETHSVTISVEENIGRMQYRFLSATK